MSEADEYRPEGLMSEDTVNEDLEDTIEEKSASRCPNCQRVMSNREASEQGCCNDCNDGTVPWQT